MSDGTKLAKLIQEELAPSVGMKFTPDPEKIRQFNNMPWLPYVLYGGPIVHATHDPGMAGLVERLRAHLCDNEVCLEIERLKTHIGTWQHHYELERQRAERAETSDHCRGQQVEMYQGLMAKAVERAERAESMLIEIHNSEATEIERLRAALEKIAADEDCHVDHKRFLARAALKERK